MNEFKKIFRVYTLITALFIGGSSALVSAVVYVHARDFRNQAREAQRQLLQSHLKGEYTRIAEEVYLKLDTLGLRQDQLQGVLGAKGKVTLAVDRNAAAPAVAPGDFTGQWAAGDGGQETLTAPLYFGDAYLGQTQLNVAWSEAGSGSLLVYLGSVVGVMVALSTLVFLGLRRKVHNPLLGNVLTLQRTAAIAQTTQMLAHDIRRPFSLLKVAMQVLPRARSASHVQEIVARLMPELQKSMLSVEGMISDIMEIGSTAAPAREAVSLESLLDTAIVEVLSIRKAEAVTFTYRLAHKHMLSVDGVKVVRVFTNILDNAVQAMGGSGEVWIESHETGKSVEIAIGNTGSEIPAELHEKVFEAFFTQGKKGGTGLGLAIAHKIVTAHGGRIWCRTPRPETAELRFVLPLAEAPAQTSTVLPTTSQDVKKALREIQEHRPAEAPSAADTETFLEERLAVRWRDGGKLKVLLVDDETFYLKSLTSHLEHPAALAQAVEVHTAATSDDALTIAAAVGPQVVICDIDMGPESLDGFAIVAKIRQQLPDAHICMHSNRMFSQDYQASIEAGANAFLLKPMSRIHLLKILATTLLGPGAQVTSSDVRRMFDAS